MPDVGTLYIGISSNASTAADGLDALAKKLGSVKRNASGFDLTNVQSQITSIVNAVKGSEKTMASLGTLFNAAATYFKTFGKITDKVSINIQPIKELKEAFGDGIKTGNVGSQLNQLRTALEGEWKTENAYNAGIALSAIGQGAKDAESANLAAVATNITAVANALKEYSAAIESVNNTAGAEGVKAAFQALGAFAQGGYVSGVEAGTSAVAEASASMIQAGIDAAADAQDSHSNSRIYKGLGEYADGGYIEGIRSRLGEVTSAVAEMVQSAILSSEGNMPFVAQAVAAAIKSAFATALSNMDLSDVQKAMIQRTANLVADVVRGFAETSKASLEDTAKVASEMVSSAMDTATSKALDSMQPLHEGMEKFNGELESLREVKTVVDENPLSDVKITADAGAVGEMSAEMQELTINLKRAQDDLEDAKAAMEEYKQRLKETGEEKWAERVATATRCVEVAERKVHDYTDALKRLQEQTESSTVPAEQVSDAPMKNITETAKTASEATTTMAETVVQAVAKADASEEESVRKFVQRLDEVKEASAEATAIREQQLAAFYGTPEPISLDKTNAMADNLTQLDLLTAQLREAEQKYNQLVNTLGAGDSKTINAGLAVSKLRDKIWELQNSSNETTSSLKNLDNELREKKTDSDEAANGMLSFRDALHELRAGIGRLFPHLTNLAHRFRSMIVMRSLRYVIRQIAAGFREGTQNVYQYSKAIGSSFAPAMDSAASSLATMKNAIGAALAPAIQALIPVLQSVINWFITLVNYANQFFALLGGASSWTRALPAQAEAFKDTAKAAGGAGKAMKDLLADWDELNIIQSQSGGGGGSGAAKTAAEYAQMFEEVNEFDNGIKDTLEFIEEHLGGLSEILRKAGLILLGWRFSRAFTGLLGLLGRLVAGGALITLGFDFVYGAAFDAGSKGYFDTHDIIRSIIGSLAMAIGGSLITVGLGLGGVLGFGIGLLAAAIVTIVGYCNGEQDLLDKNKWGNVTWTQEQIEKFVKEQFTFDVDAEIDVMNAHISDTKKAKEAVRTAVNKFSESLTEAEKIVADVDTTNAQAKVAALKAASEDAQAAIKAVQNLIDTNEEGLKFTLTNFKFTDAEGNDITENIMETITVANGTLREYFTNIGENLAKLMLDGEKSGWKNGEMEAALELMASQKRIYERAEELKNKMKFETEMSAGLQGIIGRDTAKKVFEEQKLRLAEYEETVKQSVQEQADTLTYLAALAESAAIEAGYDPETELGPEAAMKLHQASEDYKTKAAEILMDLQGAVDDKLKDTKEKMAEGWKEVLLAVYGEDMLENANTAFDKEGSPFDWLDRLFGASNATDAMIEKMIDQMGIEDAASEMEEAMKNAMKNVDPNGIVSFVLDELGMPVWSLLTEDMRKAVADSLVKNTANKSDAYELFKGMFGLDAEEAKKYIDPMYQDIWADLKTEPAQIEAPVVINPVVENDPLNEIKTAIIKDLEDGTMDNGLDLMVEYGWQAYEDAMRELGYHLNEEGRLITEAAANAISKDAIEEAVDEEYIDLDAEAEVRITIDPIIPEQTIDDLYADIRRAVLEADVPNKEGILGSLVDLFNSGNFDAMKTLKEKIDSYGIEQAFDMLKNYLIGDDWTLGRTKVPKGIGQLAHAFTVSDTSYNTQPVYTRPAIQSDEQMSVDIEKGVRNANADQNALIRELITLATRIANKQWTVNVAPSSSWGQHNSQSANAWERVNG